MMKHQIRSDRNPETSTAMQRPVLSVQHITHDFGGVAALQDVSLEITQGEIVGIIGPNGAGKTTLFNVISGIYAPTQGRVFFAGEDITGLKPHVVADKGFARTFQNIRLFKTLSVLDHVIVGMHTRTHSNLIDAIFHLPKQKKERRQCEVRAKEILTVLDLWEDRYVVGGQLPYGKQRRLEIARALATSPRLLLLDEPAAGMNDVETEELLRMILRLKEMGETILLIEHDMKFVMNICERLYVLNYGQLLADGTPAEIAVNSSVIEAYLGED